MATDFLRSLFSKELLEQHSSVSKAVPASEPPPQPKPERERQQQPAEVKAQPDRTNEMLGLVQQPVTPLCR
jgi:hypothetical protein